MFENWREKKNEEIKGWMRAAACFQYTQYICTMFTCVPSFNLLGLTVPEKSVMKNFHLKGYGMTASQNSRMTAGQGKSSIAPTFSERGYNKRQYEKIFLTCSLAVCLSPGSVFACINNSCSADIIRTSFAIQAQIQGCGPWGFELQQLRAAPYKRHKL